MRELHGLRRFTERKHGAVERQRGTSSQGKSLAHRKEAQALDVDVADGLKGFRAT